MHSLNLDDRLLKALSEDIGRGDLTTEAITGGPNTSRAALARIVAKEELVLAGWPVLAKVFQLLGPVEVHVSYQEGQLVGSGCVIGTVAGSAAVLLRGERVALNFLQRLCGIASLTREYTEAIKGTGCTVLDTRKTTPLWRDLEKYAVRVGGGANHRHGLDDGVLIKENHIAMAGGVAAAVEACRRSVSHLHKVEIEVTSLDELREALDARAEVILLDNMNVEQVLEAVRISAGRCLLEVSGGVNISNIRGYAETGVHFISLGALTHSYRSRDISMLL